MAMSGIGVRSGSVRAPSSLLARQFRHDRAPTYRDVGVTYGKTHQAAQLDSGRRIGQALAHIHHVVLRRLVWNAPASNYREEQRRRQRAQWPCE
jgi:hypothetical protein